MFNNEKGTSPVIGVMLMVVVTVILAAAVSSYSSGMIDSTEAAPTAAFEVRFTHDDFQYDFGTPVYSDCMYIKHVTGDSIKTSDLKIVTINPKANGTKIMETLPGVENSITPYDTMAAPWWNDGQSPVPAANDFGNYTLKAGVVMVADSWNNYPNPNWDNASAYEAGDIDGLHSMFADYETIEDGDWVTVKIVHMPTQKVIFQSEVEVE